VAQPFGALAQELPSTVEVAGECVAAFSVLFLEVLLLLLLQPGLLTHQSLEVGVDVEATLVSGEISPVLRRQVRYECHYRG